MFKVEHFLGYAEYFQKLVKTIFSDRNVVSFVRNSINNIIVTI